MEKINLPIEVENIDKTSPLKPDFSWGGKMLAYGILFFATIYLSFYTFAILVIGKISIEDEKLYFGNMFIEELSYSKFDIEKLENKNIPKIDNYTIVIEDSEEINAYAMIGGNIILTKGLLENLEYEEELIFIIGHEMEHIKNRDVLKGLLTDIPVKLTLYFLGFEGLIGFDISDVALNFNSRNIELSADKGGIEMINNMGLNLECSSNFFKNENDLFNNYLSITSTHPSDEKREDILIKNNKNILGNCIKLNY